MATVTIAERSRNSGKSYIVQFTDPETGQKKYHKSFRRKVDAQTEINRIRVLLDTGEWEERRPQRQNVAMTFDEAAQRCREEWAAKRDKGRIRDSTYAGYLEFLKTPERAWSGRLLATFSREEIELWHAKRTKRVSPASANRSLFAVKQVFALVCREKILKEDPAKGISTRSCRHSLKMRI